MPGYGNIDTYDPKKNRDMSWLSSIAGAASGLFGGILNETFSDKHLADAQNFSLMQGDIDWQRQRDAFNLANQRDDEVWNRQKQWNLDQWNMQNAYNSPAAQMARFKEAGLNPHLIYGQSNMGGSISTANLDSGTISGTSGHAPVQAHGADWSTAVKGLGDSLMNYVAFKQASAQVDNVKAATEVARKQSSLTSIQAANEATKGGILKSDATIREAEALRHKELVNLSVDAANENVRKVQQEIDLNAKRNTREENLSAKTLEKLASDIKLNASNMSTAKLQRKIAEYQLEMYKLGPKATDVLNRSGGKWLQRGEDLYRDIKRGAKVEWNWKK